MNRKMRRVALLVHWANWNGYEHGLYELLIRWNRSPTPIVYFVEESILSHKLRQHNMVVRVLPPDEYQHGSKRRHGYLGFVGSLRYAKKLSQAFKLDGIECVHASNVYSMIYGSLAAKWARLPIVWYVHRTSATPYLTGFAAMVLRGCCRYIPDGVMVNSIATLASLKLAPKQGAKVQLVYPSYMGGYGRREGITPDPEYMTILLVGRLTEWKGQHVLLAAAKAFVPDKKVRFWLVANEQYEEKTYREMLQQQIRSNGLWNITLFDFVENLEEMIHKADLLLHTSVRAEPFSQVIVQAMAAGIPIIASTIGGPKEIILDGETGLLIPPGDVGALRRSIRWMINHPEDRMEMGQKGMDRIKNHFSIELSLQRIMDYYQ